VVGVFGDKPVVDMGTVQDRELRLVGTLMYQQPDWVKAISLIDQGKVDLARWSRTGSRSRTTRRRTSTSTRTANGR